MSITIGYRRSECELIDFDTLTLESFECIDCGECLPIEQAAQAIPAPVDICSECLDSRIEQFDWPPRFPTREGTP